MLEEILIALSGLPGCWLNKNESWLDSAFLKSSLDLHPGESEILARLLNLAQSVSRLKQFSQNAVQLFLHQELGNKMADDELNDLNFTGYYHVAYAKGVKEILFDYTKILCSLERTIKIDKSKRNLLFLSSEIQPFFIIFQVLTNMLDEIKDKHLKGCAILRFVTSDLNNNMPIVGDQLNKIRTNLCQIFAQQLIEWLKFGRVTDKYDEFFLNDSSEDGLLHVKDTFKPNFILDHLCEKICFIGEKMKLIHMQISIASAQNSNSSVDALYSEIKKILLAENFDPHFLNGPIEELHQNLSKKLWESVATTDIVCAETRKSHFPFGRSPDFVTNNLYDVLEDIRNYYFLAKGELFLALIDDLDSYSFSDTILGQKPYVTNYTMSSGSLTTSTEGNKSTAYLKQNINNLRNEDLNRIVLRNFSQYRNDDLHSGNSTYVDLKFDLAKCQAVCHDQDENSGFSMLVSNALPILHFWEGLNVRINVGAILKPIFNEKMMQSCEKIFKFLFKVRYVHTNLHKCWLELLKSRPKSNDSNAHFVESNLQRAANNLMLFFVDNLHFYLQVDILDGFYKQLISTLKTRINDYQKAKTLIDEFMKNLSISFFMESKEVSKIIDGLLDNCLQFAKFLLAHKKSKQEHLVVENSAEKFDELFVAYKRRASLLFKILSTPKMHLTNPQLMQLLLRLDMNGYFSSSSLF